MQTQPCGFFTIHNIQQQEPQPDKSELVYVHNDKTEKTDPTAVVNELAFKNCQSTLLCS